MPQNKGSSNSGRGDEDARRSLDLKATKDVKDGHAVAEATGAPNAAAMARDAAEKDDCESPG